MEQGIKSTPPKRVLLCGVGPVPLGTSEPIHAPGFRVWGMARALLETEVQVDLLEVKFGETQSGGQAKVHRLLWKPPQNGEKGCPFLGKDPEVESDSTTLPSASLEDTIRHQIQREAYSAVIATTDIMAHNCALAAGDLPFWCDWFGHPMTERQSMARLYGSDEGLRDQWKYVLAPLLRADRFSGCSWSQAHAILGELGACGRLNRHNDGVELVQNCLPAALYATFEKKETVFRGRKTPEDAFVVLWTGGYNTWADPETFAEALLSAMSRNPRIYFVSTGGAIAGHDEKTFASFHEKMLQSPYAERCYFAGWVKMERVPDFYLEADVAVNCGLPIYEGELGTRTRILDWGCARLSVISSLESELPRQLHEQGLIDGYPCGDKEELTRLLLRCAGEDKNDRKERAERCRDYLLQHHRPSQAFKPLCDWAGNPRRAPDGLNGSVQLPGLPFAVPDNPLSRQRGQEWLKAFEKNEPAAKNGLWQKIKNRLKSF